MELNISNPMEAIYLNLFPLGQNIGFQIVATWVHLSTHPLIALTCPLSNCRKRSLQNAFRQSIICPWSNIPL